MDAAAKQADDFDTVHFPPLASGERVRCSYSDRGGKLTLGTVYTVKDSPAGVFRNKRNISQIVLLEIPDSTFPETLFDRLNK